MEISFSILGSGRIIKHFNVESTLWKHVGHLPPDEIRNVLYSEHFTNLGLKLKTGKLASTFFEVEPDKQYIAYDLDRITRLEIKVKGKSRNKIFFKDITSEAYIFPLYSFNQKKMTSLFEQGLIIIENDIGHFGRCNLDAKIFDVNKLNFDLIDTGISMKSVVMKIYYEGLELEFRKRDSLFNGNVVVIKQ